jgi:hypothetical protein
VTVEVSVMGVGACVGGEASGNAALEASRKAVLEAFGTAVLEASVSAVLGVGTS